MTTFAGVVADLTLTAQSASIGATNLYTTTSSSQIGLYRVTVDVVVTTLGAAGSVLATINSNNNIVLFSQSTAAANIAIVGSEASSTFSCYVGVVGVGISYATTVTGGAGNQYTLRIKVEFLGP